MLSSSLSQVKSSVSFYAFGICTRKSCFPRKEIFLIQLLVPEKIALPKPSIEAKLGRLGSSYYMHFLFLKGSVKNFAGQVCPFHQHFMNSFCARADSKRTLDSF